MSRKCGATGRERNDENGNVYIHIERCANRLNKMTSGHEI